MRLALEVAAARGAGRLSRLARRGGGTTLPGKILATVDPRAVSMLAARLPQGTAVVSATNGKTTTASLAAAILSPRVRLAHNSAGAAKRRQPRFPSRHSARCVKSATGPRSDWNRDLIPVLRPIQTKTGAQSSDQALFPAQHLNLPHPQQLDPWSSPRRNNAADTNPSIF